MATGIDEAQVERLAKLCGLRLSEEERNTMSHQLSDILAHIDSLAELDLESVAPTTQPALDRMPLRSDTLAPGLDRAQVLAAAPVSDGSGFCVPAFVDEG